MSIGSAFIYAAAARAAKARALAEEHHEDVYEHVHRRPDWDVRLFGPPEARCERFGHKYPAPPPGVIYTSCRRCGHEDGPPKDWRPPPTCMVERPPMPPGDDPRAGRESWRYL